MQDGVADRHAARLQLLGRADDDAVGAGVGGEHVERDRRGQADALALPDREAVMAGVRSEDLAVGIGDLALAVGEAAVTGEEAGLALAGEEAEVLALGLVGDR